MLLNMLHHNQPPLPFLFYMFFPMNINVFITAFRVRMFDQVDYLFSQTKKKKLIIIIRVMLTNGL